MLGGPLGALTQIFPPPKRLKILVMVQADNVVVRLRVRHRFNMIKMPPEPGPIVPRHPGFELPFDVRFELLP